MKRIRQIVYLVILVYLSIHALLIVYVQSHAYVDTSKPSDVVIILGTSPNYDKPNPCIIARVRQGVDLYSARKASKVIVSGGKLKADIQNESEVMGTVALDLGIREQDLFLEPNSTSTYENLLFSKKIMDDRGWKSVIIVSDPHHLPRASLIASKLEMNYSISPAVNSPCSTQRHNMFLYWLYEPLKLINYFLTAKI